MSFDKAVQAFKSNPNSENAWVLQQAMVAYAKSNKVEEKPLIENKCKKSPQLKTRKGGKWDKLFKEILELFAAFDWEVTPYKSNQYIESWRVIDKDLSEAILYLDTNGFSMGGKTPNDHLQGSFEGYEDLDRFNDFLVSNDIELEE